jgi:hypothetical protein
MNHALTLNLAIIALIVVVIAVTGNPLALLGLGLLREMPYGLLQSDDSEDDEKTRPIGFVRHDE